MRIHNIDCRTVSVPVRFPVVSCVRQTSEVIFVLVDVTTEDGVTGIAYAQAFNIHGACAIMQCVAHLESALIGRSALETDALWRRMKEALKLLGLGGLPMFALSLIDIALWDIKGKAAGVPVYQLLGQETADLEVYQSDGLWLISSQDAARQAEQFAKAGFTAMKMRLGRQDAEEDIKAAREIRRAIGSDIELMGDVNQGWTCDVAIQMADRLADYDLTWLEEPVDAEDHASHARLKKSSSIPVATGENLYGMRTLQCFLQQDAASIYTPDLQRCGGITGWLAVNDLAGMDGVLSGLHLFPEYAVHLFPSIKRPVKLEWMSWPEILFAQPLTCEQGKVKAPARPGFGMEWNQENIDKYAIN